MLLCVFWKTLKRKEKEYEHEMERLAREKIATQQRLAELKNELGQVMDVMEIDRVLRQTIQPEDDQASTSTASGTGRRRTVLCIRWFGAKVFFFNLQKGKTTLSRT